MPDFSKFVRKSVATVADGGAGAGAAAQLIPATPRRRAAVVEHDSYSVMNGYQLLRPKLFWGSLGAMLGSGVMLWLRRKHGVEAWASWGTILAASSVTAYVTRPGGAGDPGKAKPGEIDDTLAKTYRWLDARAAELDKQEPGWEEKSLSRLMG